MVFLALQKLLKVGFLGRFFGLYILDLVLTCCLILAFFVSIFIFYEFVLLGCVYFLINFRFVRIQANKAAIKEMFMNRMFDFLCLIVGIIIIFIYFIIKYVDYASVAVITSFLKTDVIAFLLTINVLLFIIVGIFLFIGAVVVQLYGTGIITFFFFHRDRYKTILNSILFGCMFLPDAAWSYNPPWSWVESPTDFAEIFDKMKTVKNQAFLDAFYMDRPTEKFGAYLIHLQHPDVPVAKLVLGLKYAKSHAFMGIPENLSILERVGSNYFFSQAPVATRPPVFYGVLPFELEYMVQEVGINTPEFMGGYAGFLLEYEGLFKSYGMSPDLGTPLSDPVLDRARIGRAVVGQYNNVIAFTPQAIIRGPLQHNLVLTVQNFNNL